MIMLQKLLITQCTVVTHLQAADLQAKPDSKITQPVNMVQLLTVRKTLINGCVYGVVVLNKNHLCLTMSLFCLISTEIPYSVARPAGTEERHSCSPIAFCLWQ